MIQILYFIIILTNLWIYKSKKINNFILIISLLFIILFMGLNNYNSDYLGYEDYYNTQQYRFTVEYGYAFLSSIIHSMGLSYQSYLCIYFTIALLIGVYAIKRVKGNYHFCLAIYLLTAVFIDVCEIRQTMAYFLYALALTYLVDNNRLTYFLLVFLAGLFQRSAYAFLPFAFLFGKREENKKALLIWFITINIFCIIVFFNGNRIPGLKIVLSVFLPADKLEYFDTKTRYGFLLFFVANYINIFFVHVIKKNYYLNYHIKLKSLLDRRERFIEVVSSSLLYLSFAMPLCMLNSEFLRYFRCSVIPIIILASYEKPFEKDFMKKVNITNNKRIAIAVYLLCYTVLFQHFRVVGEVFSNNLLF